MSDRIALILFLILAALIGGDYLFNDSAGLLFTVKKFVDMVDWVEFWR